MRTAVRSLSWERLSRLRRQRKVQNVATLGLVILGPVLAAATFLVLGPLDQGASALSLRLVLLADLVYVMVIAALVLQRVAEMTAEIAKVEAHPRTEGRQMLMVLAPK